MKRLPIRIRDAAEPELRARCLRFLELFKVEITTRGYLPFCGHETLTLDDLTTEALERLALDTVGRFWSQRRRDRRSREEYARQRAEGRAA